MRACKSVSNVLTSSLKQSHDSIMSFLVLLTIHCPFMVLQIPLLNALLQMFARKKSHLIIIKKPNLEGQLNVALLGYDIATTYHRFDNLTNTDLLPL